MKIGVQNFSTLVTHQDVYNMCLLVNRQARDHFAPGWGILPPTVTYLPAGAQGEKFNAIIGILDNADQAGDLGWHTEGPDADVYGRVFAKPVLANGGDALTRRLSVCSVLSHEVLETLGDPSCDAWRQRADGTLIAQEVGDPVESDSYQVTIQVLSGGPMITGTVSDFVLPSWFDQDAAPGATDYLGLVTSPFQVRPTGYVIEMSGGTVTSQWGAEYPEWRKATKEDGLARTSRLVAARSVMHPGRM